MSSELRTKLAHVVERPIETILQRFDKAIVHRPAALTRRQDAQLRVSLSMLLSELYLQNPRLNLVQVGALDGLPDDPLCEFLAGHAVRSILLEPQPRAYARLQESYRDRLTSLYAMRPWTRLTDGARFTRWRPAKRTAL